LKKPLDSCIGRRKCTSGCERIKPPSDISAYHQQKCSALNPSTCSSSARGGHRISLSPLLKDERARDRRGRAARPERLRAEPRGPVRRGARPEELGDARRDNEGGGQGEAGAAFGARGGCGVDDCWGVQEAGGDRGKTVAGNGWSFDGNTFSAGLVNQHRAATVTRNGVARGSAPDLTAYHRRLCCGERWAAGRVNRSEERKLV